MLIDAYCILGPRDTGLNKTEHDVTFMSLPALTFSNMKKEWAERGWSMQPLEHR